MSTEEIIGVLNVGGVPYSFSLLVSELVRRIKEGGDMKAQDKIVGLLGENENAQKYVAYCLLKETQLHSVVLDSVLVAFEKNPANRLLIETWRECSG